MDKYHRNLIARANRVARELAKGNTGTHESNCVALWRFCSSCDLPVDVAKKLYLKAGYKPFAGYPLTLKDFAR